jgi:hypothetical protein
MNVSSDWSAKTGETKEAAITSITAEVPLGRMGTQENVWSQALNRIIVDDVSAEKRWMRRSQKLSKFLNNGDE